MSANGGCDHDPDAYVCDACFDREMRDKQPPPVRRKKWAHETITLDDGTTMTCLEPTNEDVEPRGKGGDIIIVDETAHISMDLFFKTISDSFLHFPPRTPQK